MKKMLETHMCAAGRELDFRFTLRAWHNIEKAAGSLTRLLARVDGDDRPLDAMCLLCAETATAGARHAGRSETITTDWLLDHLTPKQMRRAQAMARNALTIGMRREVEETEDDEVVDVILAEIEAEERAKKSSAARTTASGSPRDDAQDLA